MDVAMSISSACWELRELNPALPRKALFRSGMNIEEGKDEQGKGYDPRKLLAPGYQAIKDTVKEKMELFGSIGKA